jgi:hypothetical protein
MEYKEELDVTKIVTIIVVIWIVAKIIQFASL